MSATEAADGLLPVAEEIEHGMARFAGAAESLEREVTGLVRIACPSDAAEVRIVPHLCELLARHPGLQVELLPGEEVVDVARRAADIAMRVVRPETGDLIVKKLPSVEFVPAAAPPLAEVLGTVRSWGDVPWVTWGDRFAHIPTARWVKAHARVEPIVRSDSLRLQIAVVERGLGVALIPTPSVAHYGLVPVRALPRLRRSSAPYPTSEVFLVTHRALRRVPRVSAVWDFLVEHTR